jgi:hypothetical protein
MPYITQERREFYNTTIRHLAELIIYHSNSDPRLLRPGDLNYCITKLLLEVFPKDMRYADFNEVDGLLGSCQKEFYRTKTGPYENGKERDNGSVNKD